jgi:5-methylcytosine-specific restriction endonuclease McrA
VCGIEIVLLKSEKRNRTYKRKYCSRKCSAIVNYRKHHDYYKKYWESKYRGEVESNCKVCGKKFLSKNSVHYTCSKKCSTELLKRNKKLWKKNNWDKVLEESRMRSRKKQQEKVSNAEMKVCPQCGKEFNPYNTGKNPYKIYCSKECQIKFSHRKQTKLRNKILKDFSLDPIAYKKHKLRKQVQDCNYKAFARGCTKDDENHISLKSWKNILERHGNKCADCGTTENITIDHIHPISKNGKNNKNNIQPLCRSCNSKKSDKIISIPHTSLN